MKKSALLATIAAGAAMTMPSTAQAQSQWYSNHFLSPSGNISCNYGYGTMACVTFNNGRGVYIGRYGWAHRFWGSQGFYHQAPRLPYNTYWTGSGFECDSSVSGMQCENPSGHGFTIAREGISTF